MWAGHCSPSGKSAGGWGLPADSISSCSRRKNDSAPRDRRFHGQRRVAYGPAATNRCTHEPVHSTSGRVETAHARCRSARRFARASCQAKAVDISTCCRGHLDQRLLEVQASSERFSSRRRGVPCRGSRGTSERTSERERALQCGARPGWAHVAWLRHGSATAGCPCARRVCGERDVCGPPVARRVPQLLQEERHDARGVAAERSAQRSVAASGGGRSELPGNAAIQMKNLS